MGDPNMKIVAVSLSLIFIFIFSAGFQPAPCKMEIYGGDPFRPVFFPDNKGVFTFGVYRRSNDGTWVNAAPIWEISHPEYNPDEYMGDTHLDLDAVVYGDTPDGLIVKHPPDKLEPGIRYKAVVEGIRDVCSREFEIVEKEGGVELGQCPPDTTERAESDGCLTRQIWFLRERLPNGDWAEPEIVPAPEHMDGGWQPMTCRDYHLLKRQAPFEIEGLSFDPKEICFLDDPRIDREAEIFTRISYDSRFNADRSDTENVADEGYFVIFYCLNSANLGKKCSCSDEDINTPDGILNCSE